MRRRPLRWRAATATAHEPPLFGLLEGTSDPSIAAALGTAAAGLLAVADLIRAGDHRRAAEHFVDEVALGPGSWAQLPETSREILTSNAATVLEGAGHVPHLTHPDRWAAARRRFHDERRLGRTS